MHVTIGHPVWTPFPMGPDEFRTFKKITVHAGNGYFLYTWNQDYAEGGQWSFTRHGLRQPPCCQPVKGCAGWRRRGPVEAAGLLVTSLAVTAAGGRPRGRKLTGPA